MSGKLNGKVAVVTGGANGIGKATAGLLAGEGADIAILDKLEPAAPEGVGRFAGFVVDLGVSSNVEPAFARALGALGRCDILINCAGETGAARLLDDTELEDWERVFRVNVTAPFLLTKAFARHAIARGGGGRIVNVSSSSGFRAQLTPPAYGTSKAAIAHLTHITAGELGLHDINVNAVAPGVTVSAMTLQAIGEENLKRAVSEGPLENLLHRLSYPVDVAEAILFLCLPASRQITGQVIHTSAGAVI